MTDNEIIKAMQCVMGNDVSCSECEYQKALPFPSCRRMCAKNALDLINRQKAENESLKVDLAKCSIRLDNLYKTADEIKSEAIKEFAERLKKYFKKFSGAYWMFKGEPKHIPEDIIPDIDKIVKEMTEVNEK